MATAASKANGEGGDPPEDDTSPRAGVGGEKGEERATMVGLVPPTSVTVRSGKENVQQRYAPVIPPPATMRTLRASTRVAAQNGRESGEGDGVGEKTVEGGKRKAAEVMVDEEESRKRARVGSQPEAQTTAAPAKGLLVKPSLRPVSKAVETKMMKKKKREEAVLKMQEGRKRMLRAKMGTTELDGEALDGPSKSGGMV